MTIPTWLFCLLILTIIGMGLMIWVLSKGLDMAVKDPEFRRYYKKEMRQYEETEAKK